MTKQDIERGNKLIADIACPREAIRVLKANGILVVTDATECIPGKFYHVLTALDIMGWRIPVMGHIHSDSDLGTAMAHIHPDHRFLQVPRSNTVIPAMSGHHPHFPLTIVRRKCRTQNHVGLSMEHIYRDPNYRKQWAVESKFAQWYRSQLGKKCKGKRCPHYGIKMRPTGNGQLECPMHFLHCDEKTLLIEMPKGKEELFTISPAKTFIETLRETAF